ncbi:hypothetical protein CBL_21343, partial [Carabus blaptoides fortunei]
VLERLRIHGLVCNPRKCQFGQTELRYLGHHLTEEGNRPLPHHVKAIQGAEAPKSRKELQNARENDFAHALAQQPTTDTPGGPAEDHDRFLVPTASTDTRGQAIVVAQTEVTTLADE